jgi:pimeloyl-ACP methyl ester carboxylesterase
MIKQIILPLLLVILCAASAFGQKKDLSYGHNDSVGRFYDIRGIKMYCEVYGSGKPLLMIHGNGGSINAFKNNIPFFAQKYKVIVPDSRAHGRTVDLRDSLSFEQMADDFAALLDAMHIDSAYVIGWSDGGINALELAMRHPDKVLKLASTGANLVPDSTGLIASYWIDEQKQYKNYQLHPPKTAAEKNAYKIFMLDEVQPNLPANALHAIKCPSLIIGGDHDLIPVQHTVQIYQNIPKAYLWIVPNSGHGTLVEHRDEFNKLVDNFFSVPFHKR